MNIILISLRICFQTIIQVNRAQSIEKTQKKYWSNGPDHVSGNCQNLTRMGSFATPPSFQSTDSSRPIRFGHLQISCLKRLLRITMQRDPYTSNLLLRARTLKDQPLLITSTTVARPLQKFSALYRTHDGHYRVYKSFLFVLILTHKSMCDQRLPERVIRTTLSFRK